MSSYPVSQYRTQPSPGGLPEAFKPVRPPIPANDNTPRPANDNSPPVKIPSGSTSVPDWNKARIVARTARTAARYVPMLGWILTAKDIIDQIIPVTTFWEYIPGMRLEKICKPGPATSWLGHGVNCTQQQVFGGYPFTTAIDPINRVGLMQPDPTGLPGKFRTVTIWHRPVAVGGSFVRKTTPNHWPEYHPLPGTEVIPLPNVPRAPPTRRTGPGGRPRPRPRPPRNPDNNPWRDMPGQPVPYPYGRPNMPDTHTIEWTSQGTKVRTQQRPRTKPRGREKEKKLVPKVTGLVGVLRGLGYGATEWIDIFDSLYKALPSSAKVPYGSGMGKRIEALYKGWDQVDWNEAIKNLIENEIEDQIAARTIGSAQQWATANGIHLGGGNSSVFGWKE